MTRQGIVARDVSGRVKWFDPMKGYGFVIADGGGPDILLHANVLREFGRGSVADGTGIALRVETTDRGVQAVEVVSVDMPDTAEARRPLADLDGLDAAALALLPLEPARVKWFDKAKGFGFANTFGRRDDIFLHVEVLRRSGLGEVMPGEAVCVKVMEAERGLMATEIRAWDEAAGA